MPRIDCSVRLDGNESPYDLEGEEKLALSERLAKLPVNRYPDPEALEVRTSLSRAVDFPVDGILLGNGSDEIIQMIVEAFGGKKRPSARAVPDFLNVQAHVAYSGKTGDGG